MRARAPDWQPPFDMRELLYTFGCRQMVGQHRATSVGRTRDEYCVMADVQASRQGVHGAPQGLFRVFRGLGQFARSRNTI